MHVGKAQFIINKIKLLSWHYWGRRGLACIFNLYGTKSHYVLTLLLVSQRDYSVHVVCVSVSLSVALSAILILLYTPQF